MIKIIKPFNSLLHIMVKMPIWQYKNKFSTIACDQATPIIVTLTGAKERVTQVAALMLKQCNMIDEIRLFDVCPGSCGAALDISLIDTSTEIKAYTGLEMLADVVKGSSIVAVCGGDARRPGEDDYAVFKKNAGYVRTIAMHVAEFSPTTILCIATPPVSAMVPLVSEEFKKSKVYDAKRIIGLTTIGVSRANSIIGQHVGFDPSKISCPIVGGLGVNTCVPVISQTEIGSQLSAAVQETLRSKIANAEKDVLNFKNIENTGACVVSPGYAIARFVTSVVRGFKSLFRGYESAFVKQTGDVEYFLPYMSSIVKLGKYGVETIHMPYTTAFECVSLQKAAAKLREEIAWGESYITGAAPKLKRRRCIEGIQPCKIVDYTLCNPNMRVDDPEIRSRGKLIPDPRVSECEKQ